MLTEEGIPSPAGKSAWSDATVRHILKDVIYTGYAAAFRYDSKKSAEGKHRSVLKPQDEWLTLPEGTVPAIQQSRRRDQRGPCDAPRPRGLLVRPRRSDFCRAISLRYVFSGLPANRPEPGRSPGIRRRDFAAITPPLRPRDRQEPGIAAGGQLTHPRNALRRFTLVRNHNAPMASFRHALTEAPQRQSRPHWDRPVNSEPRPCLFSVGFPLSGPQVRTSTSDLIRHALRTSLRPTAFARQRPDGMTRSVTSGVVH